MQDLVKILQNLGTVRLAAIGVVAVGVLVFFVFLSSRLNTTNMSLLYGDLDQTDSGKIVAKLESMNVPFELRAGGTQILVPADHVLRLRMSMAQDGLPSGGSVGYEIFDRSDGLGATNFLQNVNLIRAMEGELARTIRSLRSVQDARVHIVLPKRELFSRENNEPTASVVIRPRGAATIGKAEATAIQQLVSSAVPNLKPDRISIVDTNGHLLARAGSGDDDQAIQTSNNEEMRLAYQDQLRNKIEELLEQSVGVGGARAEVTVEMDFDRIVTNTETYDPDGQVVRSTQNVEESAQSKDTEPGSVSVENNLPDTNANATGPNSNSRSSRTEETVNYEISKTVREHVQQAGRVRRLSVAVLIDGSYAKGPNGEKTFEPRSAEELAKFEALVKSAVGFNAKRGDKVEIASMPFYRIDASSLSTPEPLFGLTKADYFRIAEIFVLAVVGILVIMLVVRPLVARTLDALPSAIEAATEQTLLADQSLDAPALEGPSGTGVAPEEEEDEMIDLARVEGRVKASTLRKISEIVERHPEETVSILRQWMYQDA